MALFIQILLTVFIAEMGDKTQLLLVAMTSRFRLRDIVLGSAAAILVLNGLAVGVGSLLSRLIPGYLIKLIAALAFFFFAWSSLNGEEDEEEAAGGASARFPVLTVFGTFFLAELGDKTQLAAITFAANHGLSRAVSVWLACSIGLFAADLIGLLAGYLLKSRTPEGFLNLLAFAIFAVFGVLTLWEGCTLCFGPTSSLRWCITAAAATLFAGICLWTVRRGRRQRSDPE